MTEKDLTVSDEEILHKTLGRSDFGTWYDKQEERMQKEMEDFYDFDEDEDEEY